MQSRQQIEVTWSIISLDLILGLVGGFTSIIWSFLGLIITPYEDFRFNNSLIGSIYPTSPKRDKKEPPIENSELAKKALESTVIERGKYYYGFIEYQVTWMLRSCCCCCCFNKKSLWWKKREFNFTRYEEAVERLNKEIDVLNYVSTQRLTNFLAKLFLRPHQRELVKSFKKYQLDDMIKEEEHEKNRNQVID